MLPWLSIMLTMASIETRSFVTVLTETVFNSFITSKPLVLVQFYASWCGHCQKLAPVYELAAKTLAGEVDLAKVDCTLNRPLCEKYEVKGFPTLILFRKDRSFELYEGEREADAIVTYLKKQNRPAYVALHDEKELAEFSRRHFVAIAWLQQDMGIDFDHFVAVANALRNDCEFGVVIEPDLIGGRSLPAMTVFRDFDEHQVNYHGEFSEQSLRDFLRDAHFPLVGAIGPANYTKYIERGLPLLWLFLDPQQSDASAEIIAAARAVAQEFRDKVSVVTVDGMQWRQHAKSLGVQGIPGAVVQVVQSNENFVLSESLASSLSPHVAGVLNGSVRSTVKSQEIPKQPEGKVVVLVGKNFEQVTRDPTKTVFVLFFAAWCGHCKNVLPKWADLAEIFADHSQVVIAKLDVTANEVRIPLQGVPTFMLFSRGNSIVYDGAREIAAMQKFVEGHLPPRDEL